MENILITGAAGFIGLNMVEELSKKEINIFAMVLESDVLGIDKIKRISDKITIITRSVEEMIVNVSEYPRFDMIFHFATVGVNPNHINITALCDTNIKMGCKMVDFASINKAGLLINIGSCFEYGSNEDVPLSESSRCQPESLYAISKNCSVNLTTAYAKHKEVKLITVRPFGVFGKYEGANRLAPLVIRHGLLNRPLSLSGGEQIRDFVDVKDVVNSMYELADSNKYELYSIYNICSKNPVRVKDFVIEIIEQLGFDKSLYKFGEIPYRENESMCFIGDNTKLESIINYQFPLDHKKGISIVFDEICTELKEEN